MEKTIKPALVCGTVLELGPGELFPGLKLIRNNALIDIVSANYLSGEADQAYQLAKSYGLSRQVDYSKAVNQLAAMPDCSVDAILSFGAMHQWEKPVRVLDEIKRVLKHRGVYFIGDIRSDQFSINQWFNFNKEPGLRKIYRNRKKAYSMDKVKELLWFSKLSNAKVKISGPDFWITNVSH